MNVFPMKKEYEYTHSEEKEKKKQKIQKRYNILKEIENEVSA